MIYTIDSTNNKKVKEAFKLKQSKYRKREQKFLIEGIHIIKEALLSSSLLEIFTLKELDIDECIPQYIVNEDILNKLSFMNTNQGVIGVCKQKKENLNLGSKLIYLDNIKDPGNLGTILRTALCFDYRDIIISSNSCDVYNDKVLMASKGSIFKLNILVDKDLEFLKELKDNSYYLYSTALREDSLKLNDIDSLNNKYILVFGNETNGVDKSIIDISDDLIKIDINNIDSLNVAIAASICMYHFKNL